jgi:leucyl/phenylalanyl-tRNA--protein transferase
MPVYALTEDLVFPPPEMASEEGLLAVGGDLSVDRLVLAYRMGIFPWFNVGDPVLWWAPDPRLILIPAEFHKSRSLGRIMKSGRFRVTFDKAFREVIRSCATARGPRDETTWITPEMEEAYCALHKAGYGHSVETWDGDQLVGGLYGVSLGGCFFGESMFAEASNASKVALATLVDQLLAWQFTLIDCQMPSEHLVGLGAAEITRDAFTDLLRVGLASPDRVGPWAFETPDGAAS